MSARGVTLHRKPVWPGELVDRATIQAGGAFLTARQWSTTPPTAHAAIPMRDGKPSRLHFK